MPPIRSVTITSTGFTVTDPTGAAKVFTASAIPSAQNTAAKVETWVNTWLAANLVGYQARVHVFARSPLVWTLGTWNTGESIPENWWVE